MRNNRHSGSYLIIHTCTHTYISNMVKHIRIYNSLTHKSTHIQLVKHITITTKPKLKQSAQLQSHKCSNHKVARVTSNG